MFWEEDIIVSSVEELITQAEPGQIWLVQGRKCPYPYFHIIDRLQRSSLDRSFYINGGAFAKNLNFSSNINPKGKNAHIDEKDFPLKLVKDSTTASEKPLMDYDSTRGQWFVNEPDAPALDNKDLTQIFDTDLNLKDKQRSEKEIVDFRDRENLQLAFSSLKLSWEEDFISPQKVLELLDKTIAEENEQATQRYIETIEIGETDAKKYFDPLTASVKDFSGVPEASQFFSAERELFHVGIVYDIIAIPVGTEEIIYLAMGLGSPPVEASLKLSTPETYTDGDDFNQKKNEYDNRALQFRQEDSLSLVLPKDTLKGETDITYFPSPKVYQDINENPGYADMAITADLKLAWEEEEFKPGDKVKLLEDWPLDQNSRDIIPAGTVGKINELPGAQFSWKSFRIQLGVEPWEIERVM